LIELEQAKMEALAEAEHRQREKAKRAKPRPRKGGKRENGA
jgi:hypothetical protein